MLHRGVYIRMKDYRAEDRTGGQAKNRDLHWNEERSAAQAEYRAINPAAGGAGPRPRQKNRLGARVKLYMLFWALLLVFFTFALSAQFVSYRSAVDQRASVEGQIKDANQRTEELKGELTYSNSDAFVEKVARQQLGLVLPGELIFHNIADDGDNPDAQTAGN